MSWIDQYWASLEVGIAGSLSWGGFKRWISYCGFLGSQGSLGGSTGFMFLFPID